MFLFIIQGYDIIEDSYCAPYYDSVSTLSEAKQQCGSSCAMFYDAQGRHIILGLCHEGAKIKRSTSGSVLYIKGTGMQNCASYYFFYLHMVSREKED